MDKLTSANRPTFITILCGYHFIFWIVSIIGLVGSILLQIGTQVPSFSNVASKLCSAFIFNIPVPVMVVTYFISLGVLVSVIGYWLYQKWAPIVYTASTIALFVLVLSSIQNTKIMSWYYVAVVLYVVASFFAVNVAMIVVGVFNFKRMK